MLEATSGIVYVRAALAPLARQIRSHGGFIELLREQITFEELFAPHFHGARPLWRSQPGPGVERRTNSGALGRIVAKLPGAVLSKHPTHCFAGFGERVAVALTEHTADAPCFLPVRTLAERHDFSMLLIGCVEDSPGFSTVHVAQHMLGLTQRHLIRYLLRWDVEKGGAIQPKIAPEAPGCSDSFDRFYSAYREDGNLIEGEWYGARWLFVPSARRALSTELSILTNHPRFVKCTKKICPTCSFRLY
jgi:aminoglycoside 3-N-acetyltransferase